jgi:hypothetical protein
MSNDADVRRCGQCLHFGTDADNRDACMWASQPCLRERPMWLPPTRWVGPELLADDCDAYEPRVVLGA